jgi:diphthine synthase
MTFYLMGLGLDLDSISLGSKNILDSCQKIYLESYTIDFPYNISQLEETLSKKLIILKREKTEDESILIEAKEKDIAFLVYGDPFSATTHYQLIMSCKRQKIPFKIFHNASIINSIAETGLSLYKFGKTASMPSWNKKYRPMSFIDYLKDNSHINAHSLLLVDISLDFIASLEQLRIASTEQEFKLNEIIVVSSLGTKNQKIIYGSLDKLKKEKVKNPFCFIIPSKLHFTEEEFLRHI